MSWGDQPVRGLEEFCDLDPVDSFGFVDSKGHPPSSSMVWRLQESTVVAQRLQFGGICEEVQRAAR